MPPASHNGMSNSHSQECPMWINPCHEKELIIVTTDNFDQVEPLVRATTLTNDPLPGFLPYRRSTITLTDMSISSLLPCSLYVLKPQLDLIRELRHIFLKQYNIDILSLTCEGTRITYNYEHQTNCIIAPPIVEVSVDDGPEPIPIIADGLHRVMIAKSLGFTSVTVIQIENTACPLIALPVNWEEVKVYEIVPQREEKRRYRFSSVQEVLEWPRSSFANYARFLDGFEFPQNLSALHTSKL